MCWTFVSAEGGRESAQWSGPASSWGESGACPEQEPTRGEWGAGRVLAFLTPLVECLNKEVPSHLALLPQKDQQAPGRGIVCGMWTRGV